MAIDESLFSRPINVVLENYGNAVIRPEDHKATGGEGAIFRIKNLVVKIYLDKNKMQKDDMPGKIRQLSLLKHPFIVAPCGLVANSSGDPIGYYMEFVKGEPLPRVFTNTFWREKRFTYEKASFLVDRMRDVVSFGHAKGATLCDPNEFNWFLVWDSKRNPEPRIVDVDSWSIGRWKSRAVMASVRDWHSKGFCQQSDWFAWGIVTFQVYTGIHPYKGRLPGFKIGDMEGRMKVNASVFSQGIRLVSAVRDFSKIPGPLLNWYAETFSQGNRTMPPSPFETGRTLVSVHKAIREEKEESLVFETIFSISGDSVIKVFSCGIVLLASKKLIDLEKNTVIGQAQGTSCNIVKIKGGWILAETVGHKTSFIFISEADFATTPLQFEAAGETILSSGNRLFTVTELGLTEIEVHILDVPILSLGRTWGVVPNETKWFDGLGIQDAMGASYLIIPFGEKACAQIRVRELDGVKPVSAKAGYRFATVIAVDRNGLYRKIEFTFDETYADYKVWQGGTDLLDLNIAILPKGVCATIVSDGELNVFVPTQNKAVKVADRRITTDSILFAWENTVLLAKGGTIWKIRMS